MYYNKLLNNATKEDIQVLARALNLEKDGTISDYAIERLQAKAISDAAFGQNLPLDVVQAIEKKNTHFAIIDAITGNDLDRKQLKKLLFQYQPTSLLDKCTITHFHSGSVTVLEYNADKQLIATSKEFDVNSNTRIIAEATDTIIHSEDNEQLIKDLINSEINITVEDKLIEALENINVTSPTYAQAFTKLGRKHKGNASIIVNATEYLQDEMLQRQNKIPVVIAPVTEKYVADLKAFAVNFDMPENKIDIDKSIKTGVYTFAASLYTLDAVLTDETAAVKVTAPSEVNISL